MLVRIVQVDCAEKYIAATILPCKHLRTYRAVMPHNQYSTYYKLMCFFLFFSCGVVLPPPGYENVIDLTKEYPDCCVHFVKKEENVEVEPASD